MIGRVSIAAMILAVAAFAQDEKVTKPESQTPPENKTMQDIKAPTAPPAAGAPAEMKTQTFHGVLVDTSCAMPQAGSSAPATTPSTPAESAAANTPPNSAQASADRAAGSCTLSSNSSQLGLKMKDGRTVRFDLVGNQRAQDALKNKKRWSEAAS